MEFWFFFFDEEISSEDFYERNKIIQFIYRMFKSK